MKLALKPRLSQLSELADADLHAFQVEIVEALGELPDDQASVPVGEYEALKAGQSLVDLELIRRERKASTEAEAVTASAANGGGQVRRMARRSRPTPSPEAAPAEGSGHAVLTAAGGGSAYTNLAAGHVISDRMELAEAMTRALERMGRHGPPLGNVLVASAKWTYPDDRKLQGENVAHNERVFAQAAPKDALVATGGICLPVNVDYTVPTWATAERPIRDALPAFEAARGGLRFVTPPDVAGSTGLGAGGGLKSATGIWTAATDASPGAATKPVVTIACGTEQLVYVEAVSTRLGFGNLQSRFAPEQIAANTDLAIAAASSVAEQNLLNLIAASCVQSVTTPPASTGLGAARDFITALAEATAAYRDAHRIADATPLTAILPRWLRHLIRADFAREIGHSQTGDWNSLILTDEDIDGIFTPFGINPVFHLDGQSTSAPGLGSSVNQYFLIQTGSGAIAKFPTQVVWYLFPEGSMQFLDGGRLDLGVVRDSTLDATNDYETFVETFEGLAYRGFASGALQLISTISATGASTGTVTTPPAA